MSPGPVRVGVVGLGPIGLEIARLLLNKPWARLLALVDIAPAFAGRMIGEFIPGATSDVRVTSGIACECDVILHATGSHLERVTPQLIELLATGHVISTCEELAYVLDVNRAAELDAAARARGRVLLGAGVNPGFVMDALPLVLSSVCQRVDRVSVRRVVDAATRREPLQRKVGAGLTVAEFEARVAAGTLRHVGLEQSLRMLAAGLGLRFDAVVAETIGPVLATETLRTAYLVVESGQVAGVRQSIAATASGREVVRLDLEISVGAASPGDFVRIEGKPDVEMAIPGGIHGDLATAAMVVHCIPLVCSAAPGLRTMADLVPHFG